VAEEAVVAAAAAVPEGNSQTEMQKARSFRLRAFFIGARQIPCASVASKSNATMFVILIIGLTAGPAVSL